MDTPLPWGSAKSNHRTAVFTIAVMLFMGSSCSCSGGGRRKFQEVGLVNEFESELNEGTSTGAGTGTDTTQKSGGKKGPRADPRVALPAPSPQAEPPSAAQAASTVSALEDCALLKETLLSRYTAAASKRKAGTEGNAEGSSGSSVHRDAGVEAQGEGEGGSGSCWSRTEWRCFQEPSKLHQPSAALSQLLLQYRRHWAACYAEEDEKQLHGKLEKGIRPKCKYVYWKAPHGGLGNHVLSFASVFVHALVTGRIFLVERGVAEFSEILCEPFDGGPSWQIDRIIFPGIDSSFSGGRNSTSCADIAGPTPTVLPVHTYCHDKFDIFYCPEYHQWAESASVLYVDYGCQYYLPALYYHPPFRAALDALFPSGRIFANLLPLVLHPVNAIWDNVARFLLSKEMKADITIGVQHRMFEDTAKGAAALSKCVGDYLQSSSAARVSALHQFMNFKTYVDVSSASENLSHVSESDAGDLSKPPMFHDKPSVIILVASIVNEFLPALRNALDERGVQATVLHLTSRNSSEFLRSFENASPANQALFEVLALALASDALFTSRSSTFGYLAVGFSGAQGHFFDDQCTPQPTEPCFHMSPMSISCCSSDEGNLEVPNRSKGLTKCFDGFGPYKGVQIISD